jgi:DNA-binding LacI/PurR family transcriptional regulator
MRRIDDETREAILELAEDLESDGWTVNRRAFAREFGVSPQTVARVLDGPNARRGNPRLARGTPSAGLKVLICAGLGFALIWLYGRR